MLCGLREENGEMKTVRCLFFKQKQKEKLGMVSSGAEA